MSLTGAGSFEMDDKGEIHFTSRAGENSLKLDTQMQAADGSILNIDQGSVATVSVGLQDTDIAVTGLRGGLSGLCLCLFLTTTNHRHWLIFAAPW